MREADSACKKYVNNRDIGFHSKVYYLTNSCGVNVLKQRAQVGEAVVHMV